MAPVAGADDVFNALQARISRGVRVRKADLDAVTAELESDKSNPSKRMVTGEAFAGLGFFNLAESQYAEADKLEKDYILKKFKSVVDKDQFVAALLFIYVEDKYPKDPALLYYAAQRNLNLVTYDKEQRKTAMNTARKELTMASALPEPWEGTLASLAVLNYNQASLMGAGPEQNKLLDEAIVSANRELARYPHQVLAQKVKIMALCRKGVKLGSLVGDLTEVLKSDPKDAAMNVLLARAFIYKEDYRSALKPALSSLYYERGPEVLSEAKDKVYTLMRKVNRAEFLNAVNEIAGKPFTAESAYRSQMFRMRIGDLFTVSGNRLEACTQYREGLSLSPSLRAVIAYKIGYLHTLQHDYEDALIALNVACRWARTGGEKAKYEEFTRRVARVYLHQPRDIALNLKILLRHYKPLVPRPTRPS